MISFAIGPIFILLSVIVIPLLVLFIQLCIKQPKVAAIIALVPLVFIASIVLLKFYSFSSHQVIAPVREITNYSNNGRVEQIIRYPNSSNQSAIINSRWVYVSLACSCPAGCKANPLCYGRIRLTGNNSNIF